MLGFTSVEGTCATNVVTLTGNAVANTGLSSVIRIDGQGDAADDLDGIAITDTNEYDLLYLFAENSGRAITVQHASGNVSTGKIYLLAGTGTKVLSTTTPMLVIRKGNDWYEYGGGAQTTPTDITVEDTTDTTCFPSLFESATGDLEPKTDAGLTYNAGNATLTATTFAGALTGNASTSSIATTVTITDNESTNENNAIVFTSGGTATGNLGLESDGDLTYNPSTGLVTVPALTITGNLTVNGTTTTINSTVTTLDDPIITLGGDTAPSSDDNKDRGVEFRWYTGGAAKVGYFGFNDSNSRFMFIGDATNSSDVFSGTLGDAEFGTVYAALSGNATTATTVTQAAQSAITSVGTLTGLTMDGALAMGGNDITNGGVIFLTEQAAAEADVTAKGQIWVDDSAPNRLFFTNDVGTDFDLTAGGGATLLHTFSNSTTTSSSQTGIAYAAGTTVGTQASGAGDRDIYVRKIDTNNEGVFALIHKNGAIVEAQIA